MGRRKQRLNEGDSELKPEVIAVLVVATPGAVQVYMAHPDVREIMNALHKKGGGLLQKYVEKQKDDFEKVFKATKKTAWDVIKVASPAAALADFLS